MIRLPRYGADFPDGRKSATFEDPQEKIARSRDEQLPAYHAALDDDKPYNSPHPALASSPHSTITTSTHSTAPSIPPIPITMMTTAMT